MSVQPVPNIIYNPFNPSVFEDVNDATIDYIANATISNCVINGCTISGCSLVSPTLTDGIICSGTATTVTSSELSKVSGVTSNIQTQLNSKITTNTTATLSGVNVSTTDQSILRLTASTVPSIIRHVTDANGNFIQSGAGFVDGTPTQRPLIITGWWDASSRFYFDVANQRLGIGKGNPTVALDVNGACLTSSDITTSGGNIVISGANKSLQLNSTGGIYCGGAVTTVSQSEIATLSGVTSSIQTQLNSKISAVNTSSTIQQGNVIMDQEFFISSNASKTELLMNIGRDSSNNFLYVFTGPSTPTGWAPSGYTIRPTTTTSNYIAFCYQNATPVHKFGMDGTLTTTTISAASDLSLNPTGSINLNGKVLNCGNGQIHNCALVHSQNNNNLVIEGKGTGAVLIVSNNNYIGNFGGIQNGLQLNGGLMEKALLIGAGSFTGSPLTYTMANQLDGFIPNHIILAPDVNYSSGGAGTYYYIRLPTPTGICNGFKLRISGTLNMSNGRIYIQSQNGTNNDIMIQGAQRASLYLSNSNTVVQNITRVPYIDLINMAYGGGNLGCWFVTAYGSGGVTIEYP